MADGNARIRVDKWLWYARFFKTRGKATELVASGAVRVNGERIGKAATPVGPGDVLTFPQARTVRVIRIEAVGERRGPAPEAQLLYTDLEPPPEPGETTDQSLEPPQNADRDPGTARPSGRDRRKIDALRKVGP